LLADWMDDRAYNRDALARDAKLIGWNFPAFEKSYLAKLKAAQKDKASAKGAKAKKAAR
jgi:hypothetical protein